MGLLRFLFKPKSPEVEDKPEIVERKIALGETKYQVIIKIHGREISAKDFFRASLEDKDYSFGRFYFLNEDFPKTHFAPSLEQAISWFKGKSLPKDGYQTISWGEKVKYGCHLCHASKDFPLRINQAEKVVIFTSIPEYQEIVGWRIIEVEDELLGKGVPTKILDQLKTYPIIKWHSGKKKYLCQNCAAKLAELGRDQELADYVVFEPD